MQFSVVLVRPEYSENIGYCARAMRNFGARELILISPKAKHNSAPARSRAMHGKEILKKAKIISSLPNALGKFDFSAATTARTTCTTKLTRTPITPKKFAESYANSGAKIAIVFGPEASGLTNAELDACDFAIEIPASREYKTLNLGHAVAVLLYELHCARGKGARSLPAVRAAEKAQLVKKFNDLIHAGEKIRNKRGTLSAFRSLISRSPITEKESRAIMGVFDGVIKRMKIKNN